MKALVTGGGGFLGLAIVRRLVKQGTTVCSFSRQRHDQLDALAVEQRQGDLADEAAVRQAVAGCDVVFHVAAVLKRAAGFVGIASGPMHVAAAVGTGVVCLFVDDIAWRPWGEGHAVLRVGQESLKRPVDVTEAVEALANLSCRRVGS